MTVDGVRLECRRIGPHTVSGPTLVFLHDGLGCADIWRNFPDRLSERAGLPGLIYSRAGYGRSDPVSLPRPLDYHRIESLQVLPAVLAAAGIEEAILIGHSDGATISLIYGASSEECRAIGIVAMAPHVFNEEISVRSIEETKRQYDSGTLRARLKRYHHANVDCAFRGWSDTWLDPRFRTWTIEALLPKVRVPVLVIQGEDDEYGSLGQVESIKRNVTGPVQSCVIPNCSHVPYREKPGLTLNAITGFLRNLKYDPQLR